MYAVVKNVIVGTKSGNEKYSDTFVQEMKCTIGKRIRLRKLEFKDWYADSQENWYYHKSWLKIEKKKAK